MQICSTAAGGVLDGEIGDHYFICCNFFPSRCKYIVDLGATHTSVLDLRVAFAI